MVLLCVRRTVVVVCDHIFIEWIWVVLTVSIIRHMMGLYDSVVNVNHQEKQLQLPYIFNCWCCFLGIQKKSILKFELWNHLILSKMSAMMKNGRPNDLCMQRPPSCIANQNGYVLQQCIAY